MLFRLQNPSKTKVVINDSCKPAEKRRRLINETKASGESSGSRPPKNGNHKMEAGTGLSTSSSDRSRRQSSSSSHQEKGKDRPRSGEKKEKRPGSGGGSIHKTGHSVDKELKIGGMDRKTTSAGAKESVSRIEDVEVVEKGVQMKPSHDDSSVKKDIKLAADVVVKCLQSYYTAGRIASKVCRF